MMSDREESIASQVARLKKVGGLFSILAWLVWVEFALGVVLGLTLFSDYVEHWGVFIVAFFLYAVGSACLFLAAWTLRVIVYLFEELRLVV